MAITAAKTNTIVKATNKTLNQTIAKAKSLKHFLDER